MQTCLSMRIHQCMRAFQCVFMKVCAGCIKSVYGFYVISKQPTYSLNLFNKHAMI